ncbi:GntR family transcriptional regulator [Arthrobacter sp. TB 23]|uniref:GntR family transcriptional regulator n=1 Tax=Arthrobacter sp. TB 23 TaxID=494419 RepID=UPI0002F777B8|nr:GntR family transcriptional regulator [Arthrobacter sp. TB 23]
MAFDPKAEVLEDPESDDSGKLSGSTGTRVADYIRSAILSGEFGPGQPVRQETLAKRLGASRLPVREALRILEGEGLVTLEPNKGARVTAMDAAELYLLYGTRSRIEPFVIADSVPRLSQSNIDRAGAILDEIEAGVDAVEFLVLDRAFHLLTYEGCQSIQLTSIVKRLWNSTQQYRRAFVTETGPSWVEETNAEHRLLHKALIDRNAEVAASIVTTHITRTMVALRRSPQIFAHDAGAQ